MTCYILWSPSLKKHYTGITTETVNRRIQKHNEAFYGKKYTSLVKDWEVYLSIECESTSQMHQIERHIKRMKSSKYIENLKKYPEMIEKLKRSYSCS